MLVAVVLLLLIAARAHEARGALVVPQRVATRSVARLVTDPERVGSTWRAVAVTDDGRYLLEASGAQGAALSLRSAGQRVRIAGTVRPLPHPQRWWWRHVRARIVIERLERVDDGGPIVVAVETLRSTVARAADALPESQRAVYRGFVLGDDRGRPRSVTEDFEGSGLAHLLVVSGENLAFVLVVVAPLRRVGDRHWRWLITLGVLALFVAVTRAEPSVLRACAMAAVAATAAWLGRPMRARRLVAFGVLALLLVDPLLVHSLGFSMSVAASLGIVWLAPPLHRWLPGPSWLRLAAAVTISAQVAVAPLSIPVFGPMPWVSLPANLLAEPMAAFVMMWGCTVGIVAGVVGGTPAVVLQTPVQVALWWVMTVAHRGAALGLGGIG